MSLPDNLADGGRFVASRTDPAKTSTTNWDATPDLGLDAASWAAETDRLRRELRFEVADEIEAFADQCAARAEMVSSQMDTCANQSNLTVVETYRQAANIARVGQDYKNTNCTNCRDTRGGPVDHKTEDCTWAPPVGFFEERDQCIGRDMIQVGWVSPDGDWWSGNSTNFVPAEGWKPVYMRKAD